MKPKSGDPLPTRFRRKAVLYATLERRLLVFTEPDHPEAGGMRHEHERSYFHLPLDGGCPETWQWVEETPDGGDGPIRMAFFFVAVDAVPELFGGLGMFLPRLRDHIDALDVMAQPVLGSGAMGRGT